MAEAKEVKAKKEKVESKDAGKAKKERAELKAIKASTKKIIEKEAKEVIEEAAVELKAAAKADDSPKKPIAKAGKRSAKALEEAEEKKAKEERKATVTDEEEAPKPKKSTKPARSKLERRSKGYRKSSELIDKTKDYSLKEALDLAQKTSSVKFDATVELHINLDVDPKQADQNIRDNVNLPAGTGKTMRVAALVEADQVAAAKAAGAAIAGEEILAMLDKEKIDFEVLVTTPAFMPKLGKYARLLGPRGLMPNPKSGTVTTDVAKAIAESRGGKVEYRVDSTGIVHLGIGKASFGTDKLQQNAEAIVKSVRSMKPASIKGAYIKSAHITTSMGPSIKLALGELTA